MSDSPTDDVLEIESDSPGTIAEAMFGAWTETVEDMEADDAE